MAEKEERILITKCSSWCHALRISCDPFDDKDGMYCDKSGKWVRVTEKECAKCKDPVLLGMSRQEAIERMAKGIVSILAVQPGTEPDPWKMWKDYAEAALDALLGDSND
jgi:hypothetical protein